MNACRGHEGPCHSYYTKMQSLPFRIEVYDKEGIKDGTKTNTMKGCAFETSL